MKVKIVFPSFLHSEFPPIVNDQERETYKRQFDRDHQEYKSLQAELDEINKRLAEVDRELNELQEGTSQYLVRDYANKENKQMYTRY